MKGKTSAKGKTGVALRGKMKASSKTQLNSEILALKEGLAVANSRNDSFAERNAKLQIQVSELKENLQISQDNNGNLINGLLTVIDKGL